jgi:hypothetical protein
LKEVIGYGVRDERMWNQENNQKNHQETGDEEKMRKNAYR